MHITANIKKH